MFDILANIVLLHDALLRLEGFEVLAKRFAKGCVHAGHTFRFLGHAKSVSSFA